MEKIEIRKRKQRNTRVVMWVTRDSFIMPVASRPRSHLTGHVASSKLGRKEKKTNWKIIELYIFSKATHKHKTESEGSDVMGIMN